MIGRAAALKRGAWGLLSRGAWSALGVGVILAAWALGHRLYGPFVLPAPEAAARELIDLFRSGAAERALGSTLAQSLLGYAAGATIGFVAGVSAAAVEPVALALQPVAVLLIGMPPVAWLVLALLWFGPDGAAPAFTVAITVAPLIFAGALQGLLSRDAGLDEMAQTFRAPLRQRVADVLAPQMAAHLAPAAAAALGFSWKVCVMAEVMANGTGIGGELSVARAHLDLEQAMAWILLILILVLAGDAALMAPLRAFARRVRPAG